MSSAQLIAAAVIGAMATHGITVPDMPEEVRPTVPPPRQSGIRFLTCALCGQGGGTLINCVNNTGAKVHKRCVNA